MRVVDGRGAAPLVELPEIAVALATCALFPDLYEDERPLIGELEARGVAAVPEVWDDPAVDWGAYELVVIRSTWDYSHRRDVYVAWAVAQRRILNPAAVVAWNTDKRYLASVPHAVPTRFLEPGEKFEAPDGEYVIKPSISAGSRDTARYGPGEQDSARVHAERLHADGRAVMVQPYLAAVDAHGETALLFFGGVYSHAIRKGQILQRGRSPSSEVFVDETIDPREPSAAERATAEDVLDALPFDRGELLYERVDMIAGRDGEPRVIEVELTEPSLFLPWSPGAAGRLADAVLARL